MSCHIQVYISKLVYRTQSVLSSNVGDAHVPNALLAGIQAVLCSNAWAETIEDLWGGDGEAATGRR